MTLFFRNATPMSNSLSNVATGMSSCSKNQVANNVNSDSVHGQQSNSTSVNKKDISVSIESPINLCYIDKSMQILGEREVKGLKTETVTIRKSLPTEIQGVLCGVSEDKEVAERMQRFRSPKCAIEYVLEGIGKFSENIDEKLKNQILRDKEREARHDLFSYEGYSLQTHAVSVLGDFVYILKRFADNDENIREVCDIFDELIENKNLCLDLKGGKLYVRRLEDYDKNIKEESVGNNKVLKQISDLLNKALEKYDVKAISSDNIQTSDNKWFDFVTRFLRQASADKSDDLADKAKDVADMIEQRNEKNGTKFFCLKSFDEVIQYISDYVESILVAERCPTKDEFRYIFGIIDKLENDDRIKFFKEKSSSFRHFSEYVAKSDKSSEDYINSESTIKERHAMYWAARFVDEMIICCQKKDFYSRFLTRFLVFPSNYVFDKGLGDIFVVANWSKGIWDFRLNKLRPLRCHTAVIGQILKDEGASFVDL